MRQLQQEIHQIDGNVFQTFPSVLFLKAYKILCTQIRAFFYAANILKFIDNIILIEKSHKKL